MDRIFQTFHVHLFVWLTKVGRDEIDQIVAGRLVAFVLRLGTCGVLFLVANRLVGRTGAWLTLLASLSFSLMLRHGESFRSDPIIAFLALAGLAFLLHRFDSPLAISAAAGSFALAAALSAKAVFFGPSVFLLFIAAREDGLPFRRVASKAAIFGAVGLVVYLILQGWHAGTVIETPASGAYSGGLRLAMEALSGPDVETLRGTLRWDWLFWLLTMVGSAIAVAEGVWGEQKRRAQSLRVLAALAPLMALGVYRNTFAYFYVSIIPGASIACGLIAARLEEWTARRPSWGTSALFILGGLMAAKGLQSYLRFNDDSIAPQRVVLAAIHELFPKPVPYIDRCGMVSAYPRVGPFMSTWVLGRYRERGIGVMPDLLRDRQPVFLVANVAGLDLALVWSNIATSPHRLLERDFVYLQEHFVHHWGPVWVAGAVISVHMDETTNFDIPVPAAYTVEASDTVIVDQAVVPPGAVLHLSRGQHAARSLSGVVEITFRYGAHLKRPTYPPPEGPLFVGMASEQLRAVVP